MNPAIANRLISNILNDPEFLKESKEARTQVWGRFGPIFRSPRTITAEDYLAFLSIKNNRHWSGLNRRPVRAADDIGALRRTIIKLVDEQLPVEERIDDIRAEKSGLGKATLTAMLHVAYPNNYAVWNDTTEKSLKNLGLWPNFKRGTTDGKKYVVINDIIKRIANVHQVDLWTLDGVWWRLKDQQPETTKHSKSLSRNEAIWRIINSTNRTATYSNGQEVVKKIKNKDKNILDEDLFCFIDNQLRVKKKSLCHFRGKIGFRGKRPTSMCVIRPH